MTTLVIHAPYRRAKTGSKSFEAVLADGIGDTYAIFQKDVGRLVLGTKVVLLRKDKDKSRAEGILLQLVDTGKKAPQGIHRYSVHFKDQKVVPYKAEKLNRFGISIIN